MSGLVYQGDAVKGLGEFFPSIFIERVAINNSSLDTTLAVYLPPIDNEPPSSEYLSTLQSKLTFCSLLGFDRRLIQQIIDRDASVWTLYRTGGYAQGTEGTYYYEYLPALHELSLDFTQKAPEIIYDNAENMLFKYSFNVEIFLAGGTSYYRAPQTWEEYFGQIGGYTNHGGKISENTDITLFCFATTLNLHSTPELWDQKWLPGSTNEELIWTRTDAASDEVIGHNAKYPKSPLPLIERNTGNVTYEHIFKEGVLNEEPTVAYVDTTGVYLDETPLQSLDAKYYKPETITHLEIVNEIDLLLTNFEPSSLRQEIEIELTGVVDSIAYALKVYGDSADLLYQLNKIRKAFPERGAATKTGRLYEAYSQAIAFINSRIKSNTEVKKQVYRNPTVVDARTPPALSTMGDFVAPTPTADGSEIVYLDKFLLSREVYYADLGIAATQQPAKALNWGYFFVDFEKILHQDTLIAQMLNVGKIDKLFGMQAMNSAVKIYKTQLNRDDHASVNQSTSLTTQVKMETEFGDPEWVGSVSRLADLTTTHGTDSNDAYHKAATLTDAWQAQTWPQTKQLEWSSPQTWFSGDQSLNASLVQTPGYGGEEEGTSYIALRAFRPLSDQGLYSSALAHDYRLMCFEFEDYYEVDFISGFEDSLEGPVGTHYEIRVDVVDRSNELLLWLKNKLWLAKVDFDDYYATAQEACNYNTVGDYFNSFFIDAMSAQYATNLASAPWNYAASIYHMYLDLIDSSSNKSLSEIIQSAALTSEKISPEAGTLSELEAFAGAFTDLFNAVITIMPPGWQNWSSTEYTQYWYWGQQLTYTYKFGSGVEEIPVYVSTEIEHEYDAQFAWRSTPDSNNLVRAFGKNWGRIDKSDLEGAMETQMEWGDATSSEISTVIGKINEFFENNDRGSSNAYVGPATKYVNTTRKGDTSNNYINNNGTWEWTGTGTKEGDVRVKAIIWENPPEAAGYPSQYLDAMDMPAMPGDGWSTYNEFGNPMVFVWLEYYDRVG